MQVLKSLLPIVGPAHKKAAGVLLVLICVLLTLEEAFSQGVNNTLKLVNQDWVHPVLVAPYNIADSLHFNGSYVTNQDSFAHLSSSRNSTFTIPGNGTIVLGNFWRTTCLTLNLTGSDSNVYAFFTDALAYDGQNNDIVFNSTDSSSNQNINGVSNTTLPGNISASQNLALTGAVTFANSGTISVESIFLSIVNIVVVNPTWDSKTVSLNVAISPYGPCQKCNQQQNAQGYLGEIPLTASAPGLFFVVERKFLYSNGTCERQRVSVRTNQDFLSVYSLHAGTCSLTQTSTVQETPDKFPVAAVSGGEPLLPEHWVFPNLMPGQAGVFSVFSNASCMLYTITAYAMNSSSVMYSPSNPLVTAWVSPSADQNAIIHSSSVTSQQMQSFPCSFPATTNGSQPCFNYTGNLDPTDTYSLWMENVSGESGGDSYDMTVRLEVIVLGNALACNQATLFNFSGYSSYLNTLPALPSSNSPPSQPPPPPSPPPPQPSTPPPPPSPRPPPPSPPPPPPSPPPPPPPSQPPQPPSPSPPIVTPTSSSSTPIGAIVGGVAGGVVAAVAAVCIFGFARLGWFRKKESAGQGRSQDRKLSGVLGWRKSSPPAHPRVPDPFSNTDTGVATDRYIHYRDIKTNNFATKMPSTVFHMPINLSTSDAMPYKSKAVSSSSAGGKLSRGGSSSGDLGSGQPNTPRSDDLSRLQDQWEIDLSNLRIKASSDGLPIKLGEGGCGVVLLGLLGIRDVAVKEATGKSPSQKQAFLHEISILKSCRDPAIVQFLGASVSEEQTVLLMEYMPGGDLYRRLQSPDREHFLWYKRGKRIALDVAKGLYYLHSRNILHLDMKSPNILLTEALEAKISDVGLAKITSAAGTAADGGASFMWASPEQLGGGNCTFASDMFSFGVILWEICTGDSPSKSRAFREVEVPREAPRAVADLILNCMLPDPADRPTAQEAHAVLKRSSKIPSPQL